METKLEITVKYRTCRSFYFCKNRNVLTSSYYQNTHKSKAMIKSQQPAHLLAKRFNRYSRLCGPCFRSKNVNLYKYGMPLMTGKCCLVGQHFAA